MEHVRGHVDASFSMDGEDISAGDLGAFSELRLTLPDHGPARFEAIFVAANPNWDMLKTVGSGGKAEITLGYGDAPVVFQGDVTTLRYRGRRQEVSLMVLEGSDRLHRLSRGTHQRLHVDVTDGDIVKKLLGEVSLTAKKVDDPGIVYPSVAQYNQTNLDFLMDRARRLGYCLWADGDDVFFQARGGSDEEIELKLGEDIHEVKIRSTVAHLATTLEVRGWDPKKKQEQVSKVEAGSEPPVGTAGKAGTKLAKEFTEGHFTFGDVLARSVGESERIAKGQLLRRSMGFALGTLVCIGAPEIRPGNRVKLVGLGKGEEGSYHVGQVRHRWLRQPGEGEEVFLTDLRLRRNQRPE